jgi:hypothetical protein
MSAASNAQPQRNAVVLSLPIYQPEAEPEPVLTKAA